VTRRRNLESNKKTKYPARVAEHAHDLLLVGINYDREAKTHDCRIERWQG